MTVRNIKKNLAGAEDLLHGIGIESQSRGGAIYEMHKLDTYVPTYDVTEMQRSSLTFMRLYGTDTAYTDYRRNPTGTVGIPSDLGGVWEPIRSSELPVCGNFTYGAYVFSSDCVVGYNSSFMQWQGDTPKEVAAGATPATSGGVGAGAWVDSSGYVYSGNANIIYASHFGVKADSDGTTGNGTDDTAAWLAAIAEAKSSGRKLIGPGGKTRITGTIDLTRVVADFNGEIIKDFDGVGVTITEGGFVFTELNYLKIFGVGTQTAGSDGIRVIDSRVLIRGAVSGSHGGSGYIHTDDNGNNNNCEIEVRAEGNGEHGVALEIGAEGNDSNNWKLDFSTFGNGGDGVRVTTEGKDWIGRVRAEDNGGIGLNLIDGRRHQWTAYLETNTGGDYNIADVCQAIEIIGRLGSGTTNNNTTYRLKTGGNSKDGKGNTPILDILNGTNVTSSGSKFIEQQYRGSGGELMSRIRAVGNEDFLIESIDRSDGVTINCVMGLDASDNAFLFQGANGLQTRLFNGIGDPNGVVTARPGDLYSDDTGGAGSTIYYKASGNPSNTGWVAIA